MEFIKDADLSWNRDSYRMRRKDDGRPITVRAPPRSTRRPGHLARYGFRWIMSAIIFLA